jgi:hypothetical protein
VCSIYLLGSNAHLTSIIQPAIPADPTAGIAGQPEVVRWSGDVEAYIDEVISDLVSAGMDLVSGGGMRIQISQSLIDLPANLPVWPNEEDFMTIRRTGVVARYAEAGPQVENLVCRRIDGALLMIGKLRVFAVRS